MTRTVSGVLAATVVASTLGLAAIAVVTATGRLRLAPVLTGSMSPAAPRGSVVVAEQVGVNDLRPGDILLFNAPIEGHPLVVHRIADRRDSPRGPIFHTRGDANDAPDVWTIRITDETAWRVSRVVPYAGSAIALLTEPTLRIVVLVGSVALVAVAGLRRIWQGPERDEKRASRRERRRARQRTRRRVTSATVVGAVVVGAIGSMGLAHALFTSVPTPPDQPLSSGQLPAPTGLTCVWTDATALQTNWGAVSSGGFATGYDVQRSNTSGSGFASIGTVTPETTTTFTDNAPGPPTIRYYVVTSYRGNWDSPFSNEVASNSCIGAVNLVAGTTSGFAGDGGAATSARLNTPSGVAVDTAGNVYIADTNNHRIRKVDGTTGIITTIAGTGTAGAAGDGGAATSAQLRAPRGVAVDSAGDVYIADTTNHKIRKVTAATGIISTIAGTGASGNTGDGGAATSARLNAPRGVAVDSAGDVYIADTANNRIRRITVATGLISLLAGTGANTACSYSGAATTVSLLAPGGVAVDGFGTVYIADTSRNCIRSVASGVVNRVAGGGATTTCTTMAVANVSLSSPSGVAVDSSGRVVFTDNGRRCVRMVSADNVVTVACTGASGSTGDNGPAVGGLCNTPAAVAANASGNVWFADTATHRVRRVEGPL